MKPSLPLFFALLSLSALSPALAQDTPPPPQAAPGPPAAVVAPEVRELLEASVKAYRALNSLQAGIQIKIASGGQTNTVRGKLLIQRPSKVRMVLLEGGPKTTVACNGQLFFHGVEGQPTYIKTTLPEGSNLAQVLDRTGALAFPLVTWMLTDSDPLKKILLPSFTAGKLGKPESIGGSVADVIEFDVMGGQGKASIAVDRADKLIRRIVMERPGGPGGAASSQTELWTPVTVNPELTREAFAYYPAPGTKPVDPNDAKLTSAAMGIPPLPDGAKEKALPGGLKMVELSVGKGKTCPPGATVTVHYTGWLADGTKFDSSVDRGQPATFGLDQVVKGWGQGIPGMKIGGKRRLIIPPALGYGEQGTPGGPIPPNATLIFDVELIAIR